MSTKYTEHLDKNRLQPISGWAVAPVVVGGLLAVILSVGYLYLSWSYISGKEDEGEFFNPILIAVLIIIALTFSYRLLWLAYVLIFRKSYTVHSDSDPFRPERTIFLAGAIFALAAKLTEIEDIGPYLKEPLQGGEIDKWLMTLLVLVPLADVYSGSWGKLRAVKNTNQEVGEIIWPLLWKKNVNKPELGPTPIVEVYPREEKSKIFKILIIAFTAVISTAITLFSMLTFRRR